MTHLEWQPSSLLRFGSKQASEANLSELEATSKLEVSWKRMRFLG